MDEAEVKENYKRVNPKILVMEAWAEGREIECKWRAGSMANEPWQTQCWPDWNWEKCDYRIRLESTKLVRIQFTFETAPFPCIIRHFSNNGSERLTVEKCQTGYIASRYCAIVDYETLMNEYEWKPLVPESPFAPEWRPCYTEVKV